MVCLCLCEVHTKTTWLGTGKPSVRCFKILVFVATGTSEEVLTLCQKCIFFVTTNMDGNCAKVSFKIFNDNVKKQY